MAVSAKGARRVGLNAPEIFSAQLDCVMSQHDDDRRELLHKRTLKAGRIVFNNRHSVIDCAVRDLSGNGARLMVASIIGIPDNFELHIGDDRKAARVVWKSADCLGVAFGEG
jgi:hypothetical protein